MEQNTRQIEINTLSNGNVIKLHILEDKLYRQIIEEARNVGCKTENDIFYDKYGFSVDQIRLHGETDIWSCYKKMKNSDYNNHRKELEDLLQTILPRPVIVKDPIKNTIRNSYKCWCIKDLNIADICDHNTAWDSWRCLMDKIGHPKYAIVVEHKVEK